MEGVPEPSEHSQKLNSKVAVDRISSLPDELLITVLNLLPTKSAFITTTLSKRWSYLFREVNQLDFDEKLMLDHEKKSSQSSFHFERFIYNMLDFIKLSNLMRFRLKKSSLFSCYVSKIVTRWFEVVLSPGNPITDLCIDVRTCLPKSIFTCKTLCIVKLNASFVGIPDIVCMPCLKILHLKPFHCIDEDAICRIFSGCPVLHDFCLQQRTFICRKDQLIPSLTISGPSLTRLNLSNGSRRYSGAPKPLLAIDAPLLQRFHYVDDLAKSHSIKTSDCLVEAHLEIFVSGWDLAICHSARDLIRGVSSVKSLFLSTHCVEALIRIEDKLPILRNLTKLELDCCTFLHVKLPRLLESTPFLEKLILSKGLTPVGFKDKDTKGQDNWGRHQIVPSCMKTHLKVIEIDHFLGFNEELRIVGYFLTNSYNLMQLIIHKWVGTKNKLKVKKRLKRLGRRRNNCVRFNDLHL